MSVFLLKAFQGFWAYCELGWCCKLFSINFNLDSLCFTPFCICVGFLIMPLLFRKLLIRIKSCVFCPRTSIANSRFYFWPSTFWRLLSNPQIKLNHSSEVFFLFDSWGIHRSNTIQEWVQKFSTLFWFITKGQSEHYEIRFYRAMS